MADFFFSNPDSASSYPFLQHDDFLYGESQAASADAPAAGLMSILSACSYPTLLPGDAAQSSTSSTTSQPTPDAAFLQFGLQFDSPNTLPLPAKLASDQLPGVPTPPRVGRSTTANGNTATAKKSTRKAKVAKRAARTSHKAQDGDGSDSADSSRERRRKQIREAQRAYRNRKETRITQLVDRVAQLESTISSMSTTVTTFTDSLLKSGVLTSHPDLASCTYETLETTLNLAKVIEASDPENNQLVAKSPRLPDATAIPISLRARPHLAINYDDYKPTITFTASSSPSSHGRRIDHATFMDQLHWAILYNAYVILTDASIPIRAVDSRFRLMFTVTTRARIAAYFAAGVHAKLNKKQLEDEWRTIPFFPLGGAGTHYTWSATEGRYNRRSRNWNWIPVPIGLFAPEVQEDLGGEWFDMQDLECFLSEKAVDLAVVSDSDKKTTNTAQALEQPIDASRLLSTLLNKAVCLGRSAGFRRRDVETALQTAVCA